ncbi:MAG: DUF5680 domain-containing protein [Candidatus Paceibacterota bacterium]
MIDKKELCAFLVKAKKATYAAGDIAKKIVEADKSTSLYFDDGDWKYHDNYFGGEPFGGREVVFYSGEPVYIMTYYGFIEESVIDVMPIYGFLQKSLSAILDDFPYRGPRTFAENNFEYKNDFDGEVDNFSGEEKIIFKGKAVYRAKYCGGFVNVRK